jgi:hypothetical protein
MFHTTRTIRALRRGSWAGILGLAALAAPAGASAQVIGGVGSSPLPASVMPFNYAYGGGMYYPAYNYGLYGGYGYPFNYGGFGYYGNPGWGYGFGGIGMTAADQWMMKYQTYALNASRYNLMNAETATAYQAANLMHQRAVQTLMQNYLGDKYSGSSPRYGVGVGRPTTGGPGGANDQPKVLPASELYAKDGQVLWPLGAPEDGPLKAKKEAAGQAIQKAVSDYIEAKAAPPVREVVAARTALADYANPAAREIKDQRPDDYKDFVNYIENLDASLRSLADVAHNGAGRGRHRPAPAEVTGGIDVDPAGKAKSAGEVLKQKVQAESSKSGNPPAERESPGEPRN